MGTSDAVPGVSGGTIALILGFYERLISSLAAVFAALRRPLDPPTRAAAWRALGFLAPLFAGIAVALWTATSLLVRDKPDLAGTETAELDRLLAGSEGLLIDPATAPITYAFFFGLVLCSLREPWGRIARPGGTHFVLAACGTAVALALSLATPASGSTHLLALVGAGVLAISVMLLPGVSGTLALLVVGMYQPVAEGLHHFDLRVIACFALGAAIGAACAIPVLRRLLERRHDPTMAVLAGLMAGSLAALWPWKHHYLPEAVPLAGPMWPTAPQGAWWWPCLAAGIGGALIVAVGRLRRRREVRR